MMLTPLWRAMGYWRWWPSNGEGWDGGGGPVVVWVGVVVAPLCALSLSPAQGNSVGRAAKK